ncbi:hypothetical protein [Actinoplanes couchii]|uniref:Uncharacterized protein n=1 Tax=Actinoplanes couchii TaxID=403638 RepID=A0ABQ3X7P5_9ACTN|nr:hypothetical protein [Actinoplanes couchii]MDR6322325.1 hypothetical protein [Actinoplanes couchii]GID54484.1 hypothetical protein Aco03nite_028880 [Actinoplanes couchii]
MFVAAALGVLAFWLGNVGELLLILGIYATAARTPQPTSVSPPVTAQHTGA